MGCGWSIFFFIAFCATMATGETVLCIISAVLMVWSFYRGMTEEKRKPKQPPVTGSRRSGGSSDGGYEGSTHYGTDTSGAPTTVHTSYGRTVDTTGTGWRERWDGSKENFLGETLEKNPYTGKWEYTDSDGDTDDRATFDWD